MTIGANVNTLTPYSRVHYFVITTNTQGYCIRKRTRSSFISHSLLNGRSKPWWIRISKFSLIESTFIVRFTRSMPDTDSYRQPVLISFKTVLIILLPSLRTTCTIYEIDGSRVPCLFTLYFPWSSFSRLLSFFFFLSHDTFFQHHEIFRWCNSKSQRYGVLRITLCLRQQQYYFRPWPD